MNAALPLDLPNDAAYAALETVFNASRAAFESRGKPVSYEARIDALKRLEAMIYARRLDLASAISADFNGRAYEETLALEIFGLLDEIRYTRKHLRRWMKPRSVGTNWQFRPSRSRILYQPLGVVGIMGAFNYPVHLTLSPLVGALAAGNHVIAKPSELAPRSGELLREIIAGLFAEDYVTIVTGDGEVSRAFGRLPFNHLLFTGSSRVGRQIMRQAADHLTPVTLELGGKSPALIARDYPLERAVPDICYAKLLNAGQTCVAPDYVLVHEDRYDDFMRLTKATIAGFYPSLVANPDYTRLITAREHARLSDWVEEARSRGAKVDAINPKAEVCDANNRVFAPTLVSDCPEDAQLMRNEIFGPVLPVLRYRDLDEALARIKRGSRPLALYYFDNDRSRVDHVLDSTISGGVTINGCVYHVGQHSLPFGGVGDSGMGHYHGFDGFETFSKKRPVFHVSRLMNTALLRPPFGTAVQWMIGILLSNRLRRERLPHKP